MKLNMLYLLCFYALDPLHTTVNSIGSATINALMTAKLGDSTIGSNRSKYPSSNNTSPVIAHKQNKPWSAVLHDIFVSLADDSSYIEHQNDVIILYFCFDTVKSSITFFTNAFFSCQNCILFINNNN